MEDFVVFTKINETNEMDYLESFLMVNPSSYYILRFS